MSPPFGPLIPLHQRPALYAGAQFVTTNFFTPEWVALQRVVLRERFDGDDRVVRLRGAPGEPLENTQRVGEVLWPAHEELFCRLEAGATPTDAERMVCVNVGVFRLYDSVDTALQHVADGGALQPGVYTAFRKAYDRLAAVAGEHAGLPKAAHLFALFYQMRRAFHVIHTSILGISLPVARLRAAIWDAIFAGGDLRRYAAWSFDRMERGCTLVVGLTGTGKELVARALGLSRYLAFNEKAETFAALPGEGFHTVNIAALPAPIVDTLLFGHAKGTFTGAEKDALGVLHKCKQNGTLFMDEIGDLACEIQVKLLRVLQEWKFTRLGDTEEHEFWGRIVAAVQPSLLLGDRLREDFYHRISECVLQIPSLAERIQESPGELGLLVRVFAERKVGPAYADALTEETLRFLATELPGYAWPGNVRELQGCVSNIMSHHVFLPRSVVAAGGAARARPTEPRLPALARGHAEAAIAEAGGKLAAARLLGVNFRTLRKMLGEEDAPPARKKGR